MAYEEIDLHSIEVHKHQDPNYPYQIYHSYNAPIKHAENLIGYVLIDSIEQSIENIKEEEMGNIVVSIIVPIDVSYKVLSFPVKIGTNMEDSPSVVANSTDQENGIYVIDEVVKAVNVEKDTVHYAVVHVRQLRIVVENGTIITKVSIIIV